MIQVTNTISFTMVPLIISNELCSIIYLQFPNYGDRMTSFISQNAETHGEKEGSGGKAAAKLESFEKTGPKNSSRKKGRWVTRQRRGNQNGETKSQRGMASENRNTRVANANWGECTKTKRDGKSSK